MHLVGCLEIFFGSGWLSLHGLLSRLPVSRAHLAVLIGELERLHKSERLVDTAANWQIVDGDLTQDAFAVNDEQASERDTFILL